MLGMIELKHSAQYLFYLKNTSKRISVHLRYDDESILVLQLMCQVSIAQGRLTHHFDL
jgi:hypothetical protein